MREDEIYRNASKEQWIEWMKLDPRRLILRAPANIRSDRDVIMAAVQTEGLALRDAMGGLRNDREIVKAAIQNDGYAFPYVGDELKADKEIAMLGIQNYRAALEYVSPELQADRDVVMAAVSKNGAALEYASPELQADRDVVMAAVSQNGAALEYASPELQQDQELQMIAKKSTKKNEEDLKKGLKDLFASFKPRPMMSEKEFREQYEEQQRKKVDYLSGRSKAAALTELFESAVQSQQPAQPQENQVIEWKESDQPNPQIEPTTETEYRVYEEVTEPTLDLKELGIGELDTIIKEGKLPQQPAQSQEHQASNKL